ncbi:hypothetical protein [Acinetobacter baumannii]|uniref:hypothetical protein n=1 Tax=Acinetobacter baumannii TaxID=470 RepID=UPI00237EF886|nr:hypothetical protein [Acinetobacter baumannii]MDE3319615.1 hypothetical protein [Acinetobacter baumannii]MDX5549675.1 hypothetical protein [Acinetobacter baumannii]
MKVFIYSDEGRVCVGTSLLDDIDLSAKMSVPENTSYFIVDRDKLPTEPQESWVLHEDGTLTIDQQKLIQFKREQIPQLTPIEFDLKLAQYNLYDAVQALVADNLQMRIAYTRATFFSRTDPFIDQARIALNLTNEQVDAMWQETQNN